MARTLYRFQVGGTNTTGATRSITAPELKPGGSGWRDWVAREVMPVVATKPDGLELWTPGGIHKGDTLLQADQMLEAKAAGYPWRDFVDAWKPVTAKCEVIFYGGCLGQDESFKGLSLTAWLDRTLASYRPAIDAGMSVAFDASAGPVDYTGDVRAQERAQAFVAFLSAARVPVYVEPYWAATGEWCHRFPAFVTEQFYRVIRDQQFVNYRPLGQGDLYRILNFAPCVSGNWTDCTPADVRAWIDGCHADGHNVSVGADWCLPLAAEMVGTVSNTAAMQSGLQTEAQGFGTIGA